MIHTVYSRLTNDEFLSKLQKREGKSPVIDECIRRLLKMYELETCPVCEAKLEEE